MAYKVINGSMFRGSVPFYDKDFWPSHRHTEKDFVDLLKMSFKYFNGISSGTVSIEDRGYFICAPQIYLDDRIAGHIDVIDDSHIIRAAVLYVDHGVHVIKKEDGYYFSSNDGRHRFMTAKNYALDLLVCVDNS